MDERQRVESLFERSLFAHLLREDAQALAKKGQLTTYIKGQPFIRPPTPAQFNIVVDGEISLRSRNNNSYEYGRIIPGRSIELRALLSNSKNWDWDWFIEERTTVLSLPWEDVLSALKRVPETLEYLHRITCNVELQKFKRDLGVFAFTAKQVKEIILALRLDSFKNVFSNEKTNQFFFVLSDASFDLRIDVDGQIKLLASYQTGDNFYLLLGEPGHFVDAKPSDTTWYLTEANWNKLSACKQFVDFIQLCRSSKQSVLERSDASDDNTQVFDENSSDLPSQFKFFLQKFRRLFIFDKSKSFGIPYSSAWTLPTALSNAYKMLGYEVGSLRIKDAVSGFRGVPTLEVLRRISSHFGFYSQLLRYPTDIVPKFMGPAIFIVGRKLFLIQECHGRNVYATDVEKGITGWINIKSAFSKYSTFDCLMIGKSGKSRNLPDSHFPITQYAKIFKSSLISVLLILMAGSIAFGVSLILPLINESLIDRVFTAKRWGTGYVLGIVYGMCAILAAGITWARQTIVLNLQYSLDARFSGAFFSHLFLLPAKFFDSFSRTDIMSRFEGSTAVVSFLLNRVVQFGHQFLSILLCFGVLWFLHPKLFWAMLLIIPVLILVGWVQRSTVKRLKLIEYQYLSRDRDYTVQYFDNIEALKSLNCLVQARWRWEANFVKLNNVIKSSMIYTDVNRGIKIFTEHFGVVYIILVGIGLFQKNELSIGAAVAAAFTVELMIFPVVSMLDSYFHWPIIKAEFERLSPIFSAVPELESRNDKAQIECRGDIEFDYVSFSFSEAAPNILDRVSLRIKEGEMVAITGLSGSGKSTLASLFTGLRKPTSGSISIGSNSLEEHLPSFKNSIGYMPQTCSLTKGTVLENIAFGDPNPSLEKANQAAYAADALDFILKMPRGFSSLIERNGVGLSDGQAQRILLARTIYSNPKIFILDEFTSHLDPIAEEKIVQRFLEVNRGKRTVVFITQHPNLLAIADRILLVHNQTVVEDGAPAELLKQRGLYFELFLRQMNSA